jgi:type III pantothenate kinase
LKLIIDIGNTCTKLAIFKGKSVFKTLNTLNCTLIKVEKFVSGISISCSIISSVKLIDTEIINILNIYNGFVLNENIIVPIKNSYKTLDTLGMDRLASVVGASYLYPKQDIIILDLGTCLTIDFISRLGEYFGGRISPGIEMRYKALHNFTDKLPLIKKEKSNVIIGEDTHSSISAGVQQGVLAEIKMIISDYRLQKPDAVALITGGDCFFFEKELKNSIFANPNLVLIGLNEILDFNV